MTRSIKTRTLINSAVVLACSASLSAIATPNPTGSERSIQPFALHNEQGDVAPMREPRNPCNPGTPWFSGIGFLQDGWDSDAFGVSPDGVFVVGSSTGYDAANASAGYLHAVAWNSCIGIRSLPYTPASAGYSTAYAISNTGRHIAGLVGMSHDVAGLWANMHADAVTGLENPSLGYNQRTIAKGVSSDGTTFAGTAEDFEGSEAFVYVLGEPQARMLGDLPGGMLASEANGISNYGNAVIGRSSSANGIEAFLWTETRGMIGLGDLDGGLFDSTANAVNADGTVVVGSGSIGKGREAFRWTAEGGMVSLGDLPGGEHYSEALGVSADGTVIVGRASTDNGYEAFIWTATTGMRTLRSVMINQLSPEFASWQLTAARGVSANGRIIVGSGVNTTGMNEGWVMELAEQCRADWNADAVVNSADFFDFLNDFFSNNADFTGDHVTNSADFFDFLTAFFAGC